jgi:esterase/lipase
MVKRSCLMLICPTAMVLVSCATPLTPLETQPTRGACVQTNSACYAEAEILFKSYRDAKISEIKNKSNGFRLPSAPVASFRGNRTEYAALLIHGLNDSAYYMADLAQVFEDHDINTVTLLLSGHGTFAKDILNVKAEDWRSEALYAFNMASLAGEKVVLGGFSLGATLALDLMLQGQEIHGLFLFSPALELQRKTIAALTCLPLVRSRFLTTDLPRNSVKYTRGYANGVCQLHRLMKNNIKESMTNRRHSLSRTRKFEQLAEAINVPTFIALSYGDIRITHESVVTFANHVNAPTVLVTYGAPASQRGSLANGGEWKNLEDHTLPHSYLVRKTNEYNGQMNPYFDTLQMALSSFIRKHFQ